MKFLLTRIAARAPGPAGLNPFHRDPEGTMTTTTTIQGRPVHGRDPRHAGRPRACRRAQKATIQLMGSRLWGRFNPNHWDPVYAAATGLQAPSRPARCPRPTSPRCASTTSARPCSATRVALKYVGSTLANEVITTHGVVRAKTPGGRGLPLHGGRLGREPGGRKRTVGVVEADVGV